MSLVKWMGMALVLAMVAGCSSAVARPLQAAAPVHIHGADRPAVHGMLIVGDKTVYLSHLPMFHAPHDYQAVFEATFRATGSDPQRLYAQDRAKTGEKVYTLVPEPFVLSELNGSRHSFKADIYRGHFERGGQPIAEGVTVEIRKVVHFCQFEPQAQHPASLQYLVFGKGGEAFAAHLIHAAPDYDQVLPVKVEGALAGQDISAGVQVTVPQRPDGNRLHSGERVPVQVGGTLSSGTEFYYETGDLAH